MGKQKGKTAYEDITKTYSYNKPNSADYTHFLLEHAVNDMKGANGSVEVLRKNAMILEDGFNVIAGYKLEEHKEDRGENVDLGVLRAQLVEGMKELLGNNFESKYGLEKSKKSGVLKELGLAEDKELTGTNFEKYLDYLFNNIKKRLEKGSISNKYKQTYNDLGTSRVSLDLNTQDDSKKVAKTLSNQIASAVSHDMNRKAYIEASKWQRDSAKEWAKTHHCKVEAEVKTDDKNDDAAGGDNFKYDTGTSGKIDSAIKINVRMKIENEKLAEFVNLLKQATFSDKAYKATNEITLGRTNPYRVYTAVSSRYPHMSSLEKYYRWHRLVKCMDAPDIQKTYLGQQRAAHAIAQRGDSKHSEHNRDTILNFYMLRYIYELSGYGQKYIEEDLQKAFGTIGAQYLIFHKPGSQRGGRIKVVSTGAVAHDLVNAVRNNIVWHSNSLKEGVVGIDKSYAINAKIKLRLRQGFLEYGYTLNKDKNMELMNLIPEFGQSTNSED